MQIEKSLIVDTLKKYIRKKLESYKPETRHMPFYSRFLGNNKINLFSIIHYLNDTFDVSIFEPIAKTIAQNKFKDVNTQVVAGCYITDNCQKVIQEIIDSLRSAEVSPNWESEYNMIKIAVSRGNKKRVKLTKVDIFLEDHDNTIYLFDLKTVKPNKGSFIEYKRTLLEWTASSLISNQDLNIKSMLALPYNPYHPKPYSRWTMAGMIDVNNEVKIGSEFWNFIGGEGTFEILLDSFEKAGIELRDELNNYFTSFNN